MDEATTVACCVCHSSSNQIYENFVLLQTKYSHRSFSTILILILGEESTFSWSKSDPICYECVGKINDYDEAFEKMQIIERQLRLIHGNINTKQEIDAASNANVCTVDESDANEFDESDANRFDSDNGYEDFKSEDSFHELTFNEIRLVQSENFTATPSKEEHHFVGQKSDNEPVGDQISNEMKKSEFYCEECGRTMQTYRGLTIHMTKMHKEAVGSECSVCHTSFPNKHLLEKHTGSNGCRQTEFYCEECGKNIYSYNGLMIHMAKLHKNAVGFECPVCHKFFPNKHLLEKHTALASCRQMDFKCQICHKSFLLAHTLKNHMKTHKHLEEMEPPFECDCCGVEFDEYATLEEHKKRHLNRPDFQCIECDRVLKRRTAFKLHMQTHSKQHQTLCDVCGKAFGHPASLQSHLKYHFNDLKMECYLCKLRAISAEKLRRHMRRHTGEKPYSCEKCGKRFAQRQGRNRHFRLHFGPAKKPHKCTMCVAAFVTPIKLTKHCVQSHGMHITMNVASNRVTKVERK